MYLLMLKAAPNISLSDNFRASEVMCRCSRNNCNHSFFYKKTIVSMQELRELKGVPIHVTSGYRCQEHNSAVGGLDKSYHMRGHAVDLEVPEGEDISVFSVAARMFFDVVVVYEDDNFIHCHNI